MAQYTVQAGKVIHISSRCGCKQYVGGDTIWLSVAWAKHHVDNGTLA